LRFAGNYLKSGWVFAKHDLEFGIEEFAVQGAQILDQSLSLAIGYGIPLPQLLS